jgi:two-component system, LuxR family, sensor kinase FixL
MESTWPFDDRMTSRRAAEDRHKIGHFPRFCVIFALLLSVAALAARQVELATPALAHHPYFHVSSLMMTGELLIALGVLAAMSGARLPPMIPLSAAAILLASAIFASALAQPPIGWRLPVLILNLVGCTAPAHSSLVSRFILFVLTIATMLAVRGGHRTSQLAVLLASLTLGISFIAGIGLPLATGNSSVRLMSGLAATAAIALSAGLIGWRHRTGWPDLSWDRHVEGTVLSAALALCIITPVSFALLRRWTILSAVLSWPVAESMQVGAQIVVSTTILFWAWSRISGDLVARREFARALDAAPIAVVTMAGEIVHWSAGCERLYQWTAHQALGRIKHDLLGNAVPGRWESLKASLAPGRSSEEELVEHRRDGTPLFVLEQAWLMPGAAERPAMIILSMTDISARARAEEALRASDARLALAVEALELGLFEWRRDGDVLTLSAAAAALAGTTEGDARSGLAGWRRRLHARFDIDTFPNERLILRRQMPRFGFRMRQVGADGSLSTVEGVVRCVYDPDGKLSRVIGVMFDTSEREQGAEALQARESELRTILAHVPDPMVTIDERGWIRSFSTAAEQLLGYSANEVIGHDVKLLMPARHHAQHDHNVLRYLATGTAYLGERRQRTAVRHRDGHEIPIELAVGEAEIGRERIFIAFLRDLSDQLAAQARLTELRDELVHVSRLSALGEMAAGLAHELNQPLAAIANFLGAADVLLENGEPTNPDQLRTLMRMSSVQVLRAGEIMQRVRHFASRGAVDIQPEPLAEVLGDAVELLLTNDEWRFVRIRYAFDPAHPVILADRVQIQQVIVNLVRNALEAVAERPNLQPDILIESRGTAEGMVEILVNDNGPGVAPEIVRRHHAPFYSTKADGMGIGLSICRRIIEAHGGSFVIENRAEGGATMRFTVPSANSSNQLDP